MKLDQKTTLVLKSFCSINPSILFRKGDYLTTVSPTKTLLAKAKIDQEFGHEFAIHDLSKFLGAISLFTEPDLSFTKDRVRISSGTQKIWYTYAAPDTIVSAPDDFPKLREMFRNTDVRCSLPSAALKSVQNAANVLRVSEIAFVGDGKKISVQAFDKKNPDSDLFSMEIGDTNKEFKIVFQAEYLKILPQDYNITIARNGIFHFKGEFIEYWIVADRNSSELSKL